jgi:putative transposase
MNRSAPKVNQIDEKQVHRMALASLEQHLQLNSKGSQSSAPMVWDVLLAAAAHTSSIDAECEQHPGAASANTIRGVIADSFEVQTAEVEVNEALWHDLDRRYWKQAQTVAVDLVKVPYYGQPAREPNEVRRGKAEKGTTYFHVFATAYVIRKHRRVTLALHYVRKDESLVSVLDALKGYLDRRGIQVKLWLADRAFCSVAALKWLDQQPEAIVPMIARGKQDPPSGSRVLFESNFSHWTDYTMSSDTDGEISLQVAVVRRYGHYARRQHTWIPAKTLVYVVVGKNVHASGYRRSVDSVMAQYKSRFGIESSYRQMNQGRLRTSSRSPTLRLLAVAIALLLRNLWALCSWMSLSHPGPGRRGGVSKFRLQTLLRWIAKVVDERLGFRRVVKLPAASAQQF